MREIFWFLIARHEVFLSGKTNLHLRAPQHLGAVVHFLDRHGARHRVVRQEARQGGRVEGQLREEEEGRSLLEVSRDDSIDRDNNYATVFQSIEFLIFESVNGLCFELSRR